MLGTGSLRPGKVLVLHVQSVHASQGLKKQATTTLLNSGCQWNFFLIYQFEEIVLVFLILIWQTDIPVIHIHEEF